MPPYARSNFFGIGNSPSSSSTTGTNESNLREANKALHELESAFDAVFDFLERNGVSYASVQELRKQMEESDDYVAVIERAQQYVECLSVSISPGHKCGGVASSVNVDLMSHLFVRAWENVHQYMTLLYREAYKNFHHLRRIHTDSNSYYHQGGGGVRHNNVQDEKILKTALDKHVQAAEECSSSLKGLILAREWEKSLLYHANRRESPLTAAGVSGLKVESI